jgi:hypothetical protein
MNLFWINSYSVSEQISIRFNLCNHNYGTQRIYLTDSEGHFKYKKK